MPYRVDVTDFSYIHFILSRFLSLLAWPLRLKTSLLICAHYCSVTLDLSYVDKSKIYLFAFGREHGNYSGATPDTPNCTWVQWYHFLNYILRLEKNSLLISKMHKELKEESPYTVTIKSRKRVYKYGKYRFVY